uniref:Uncharacterized protein n=1 Tax=Phage sp. ctL4h4 TaxID=2828005 RepID=A0A8S5TFM7_9VIRU|nr:MAG TPA: hypothetical protein [Phage sp. ctL4h4]
MIKIQKVNNMFTFFNVLNYCCGVPFILFNTSFTPLNFESIYFFNDFNTTTSVSDPISLAIIFFI